MKRCIHLRTYPVSRAKNASAVAGAAYRAGENLKGIGQGKDGEDKWFRYGNRKDVVRETFIVTPNAGGPDFLSFDQTPTVTQLKAARAELWNEVEALEEGGTARLGREIQLGLAHELSHDEQRQLITEFVRTHVTDGGTKQIRLKDKHRDKVLDVEMAFVADVAIHNYGKAVPAMGATDDQLVRLRNWIDADIPFVSMEQAERMEGLHVREKEDRHGNVTGYQLYQPHAHIRVTPRTFVDGQWAADKYASRLLNEHRVAMNWRYEWPKLQNAALKRAGYDLEVTCTSQEEDQVLSAPRFSTREPREVREIEERSSQLSDEKRQAHEEAKERIAQERFYNDALNESIRIAVSSGSDEPDDGLARFDREYRLAGFMRSMSQRFGELRERIPKAADDWRVRIGHLRERMRTWLGYDADVALQSQEQPPDNTPQPERGEPEQDR